jgi:hypothetical protein
MGARQRAAAAAFHEDITVLAAFGDVSAFAQFK